MVRSRTRIVPITAPGGAMSLIHQFADDTTITVRDMEGIDEVMKAFDLYGRASGAKISIKKLCIMQFGDQKNIPCKWEFERRNQNIRIMGIVFGEDAGEARDLAWGSVINKIKQILAVWKGRSLNVKGRAVVLNALVFSRMNYVMSTLDLPV
uniref:Reverse transcriptase domain-containing protein n=1 Tax=Nothobranchius furzeri TaxID=105023 RepID=A0A1A8B8E8_NOTFU